MQDDGVFLLGLCKNMVIETDKSYYCGYSQYTGRNPRILTCKDFKVLICCLYSISNSTYMHMRSARRHSETLSKNSQGPQCGLSSLGPLCPLFVLMIRELYIYKSSSFFIFRNLAWIRDSMTEKISYRRSYRTLARRRRMRCRRFNTDLILSAMFLLRMFLFFVGLKKSSSSSF